MSDPVRIGILGRGTVGGAFASLIAEGSHGATMVESITGAAPQISGVLRRDQGSFPEILESSDIIVELIGGTDPTREYVLAALRAGRHVITANKQLVARHGPELFDTARENGVQLRFEAAVAGVIPVIRVIQESLAATRIEKVAGIVNGTTNYILTQMAKTGATYDEALAQAQAIGYAEADPSEDVNGADAAAKMAILARLSFDTPVSLEDVSYQGIEAITPDDLAYAREFGLSLKLLGVAERVGDAISVRVFPCFLYQGHPLAHVEGAFNAVTVEAPDITEITMSGPGAGGIETATAVLGDLVSLVGGSAPVDQTHKQLEVVSEAFSSYYLHLEVADEPGVLATITKILGERSISVKSVVQRAIGDEKARLEMVLHLCPEPEFDRALEEIKECGFLQADPRAIRVIEAEFG